MNMHVHILENSAMWVVLSAASKVYCLWILVVLRVGFLEREVASRFSSKNPLCNEAR